MCVEEKNWEKKKKKEEIGEENRSYKRKREKEKKGLGTIICRLVGFVRIYE